MIVTPFEAPRAGALPVYFDGVGLQDLRDGFQVVDPETRNDLPCAGKPLDLGQATSIRTSVDPGASPCAPPPTPPERCAA